MANDKTKVRVLGVPVSGSILSILAVVAVMLLLWLAREMWETVAKVDNSLQEVKGKIERLESDEAKWAAMADMRNELTQLQVNFEVMRRVWEYEYQRNIPIERPEEEKAPEISKEDLEEFLRERELSAEEFKRMQQHLIPRKKK